MSLCGTPGHANGQHPLAIVGIPGRGSFPPLWRETGDGGDGAVAWTALYGFDDRLRGDGSAGETEAAAGLIHRCVQIGNELKTEGLTSSRYLPMTIQSVFVIRLACAITSLTIQGVCKDLSNEHYQVRISRGKLDPPSIDGLQP